MIYEIILTIAIIASIAVVIYENRRSDFSVFWIAFILLLPVVGVVFFFLLGKDHRRRHLIQPDDLAKLNELRDHAVSDALLPHPPSDNYQKLADMMRTANDTPLLATNQVDIYTDFSPMFEAMLKDIEAARSFIHIQFYIIDNDEVGRRLSELLIRKVEEGVDVRLIYDSWANIFVSHRYYSHMRKHGVKVQGFQPFYPSFFRGEANCRTHRKIVVIDGHTGYTGGMNIARRYRDGINNGPWRDTHLRLLGPPVTQLEVVFLSDWRFCAHELLLDPKYFPPQPLNHPATQPLSHSATQIVTSGPMDRWDTIMQGMVHAIEQSRHYLYIQTPYFTPTAPILMAIQNAALAGVDVRLMLPATTDRGVLTRLASQSYFRDLIPAGVKIYRFKKGFMHAKTIVCDDDFATIGSTNLDPRSMEQNFEVNAFFYGGDVVCRQRDIFLQDQESCTLVDPDLWQHRSILHKFLESAARVLTPIL